MVLNPVTAGTISGTGTVAVQSGILGAVLLTANGTNDATVVLRKDNSSGAIVYNLVSKAPLFTAGPIRIDSQSLYYSISGTGASAQLYEWAE